MKKLLMLALTLSFAFLAKAQIPAEKLFGTWTLIKYDYGNGNTGDQTKAKFRKIMTFTKDRFTVLDFDTAGRVIKKALWGGYTPNYSCCVVIEPNIDKIPGNSILHEYIVGTTDPSDSLSRTSVNYELKLDDDGLLQVTGLIGNNKTSELWMHERESVFRLTGDKDYKSVVLIKEFGFDERALLIVKTKDKEIRVICNSKYPEPFAFLKDEDVEFVELLGAEEAIQRYKMDGRFGVFILQLKDKSLPSAIVQLRKQKSMD
jgi:hypothetical protein